MPRTLADVTRPAPARRVAALVREAVEQRPETAAHLAAYVDRRLEYGLAARAVLLPLVTGLLDGGPEQARAALAAVLAALGAPASPDDWATVVGPRARRMIENFAGLRTPA